MPIFKTMVSAAALAASLTFTSSAVSAAVVDFDVDGLGAPISANTPITNQYVNLGVLFEGLEDGAAVDINAAPDPDGDPEPTTPNVLTNCSSASVSCPGNRADIVRISFASAVSQVSLMLNTLGSSPVTFELYDDSNTLLETLTQASASGTYELVSFAATGIFRIDGVQPNDGWAWAMDDLTFTPSAPVPVPAPLLLLGTALAGLGAASSRRRRRSV